jgi:glycosyltransferase involved in cell wall biosynthesis
MHLGLYHEPVHFDGAAYDTYGPFARYIAEFARHFERVTVFAPVTEQPSYFSGCRLEEPNVTVVALPWFTTHAGAYRHARAIYRAFRRHADSLDVINARGTAPLAYLLWFLTRRRGVPFVYHFASDPFEIIAASPKYRGVRRPLARLAYGAEFAIQKHILRQNFAFASGEALARRLRTVTPAVEAVMTSSLQPQDYLQRPDTCLSPPIRLLSVGHLRREKGLDSLIQAVDLLRKRGRDVVLEVVGSGAFQGPLEQLTRQLGLAEQVKFSGHVQMGPALNDCYARADIFALPSLSEGSPKVVLEAMAHSVPVVATPVGNVPEVLEAGRRGVLVAAGNAAALAEGIDRLLTDGAFRQQCIREGFAFARQHGVEQFVARMAEKMRQLVTERRSGGAR